MTLVNQTKMILICDLKKCTGCRICEYVCSFEKEKNFDLTKSRIKVVNRDPTLVGAFTCSLCNNATCVKACPTGALSRLENREIVLDKDKCVRCGWCIYACDMGGIFYDSSNHIPIVCDLCGEQPKCAEICPEEALKYESLDNVIKKQSISNLRKVLG